MIQLLQILTILIVAVLLATVLAHALEMPGKMRLGKDAYFATQTIYWPGFTVIGGGAEVLSLVATLVLAILMPEGSADFWLTLGAFILLVALHAVYWVFTHPANKLWVKDLNLEGGGRTFFETGPGRSAKTDWREARNRWEYSHAARALLALVAFVLILVSAILEN